MQCIATNSIFCGFNFSSLYSLKLNQLISILYGFVEFNFNYFII